MAISVDAYAVSRLAGPGLRRGVHQSLRLAGQFTLLVLLLGVGTVLAQITAVPLPGNLIGMLLLLALLHFGVLRLEQIQDLAGFGIKHLNFFFVPYAVGLMTWTELFATSGIALAISLIGSTIVCLAVTGLTAQHLAMRAGGPDGA
jgi:holin-like protein